MQTEEKMRLKVEAWHCIISVSCCFFLSLVPKRISFQPRILAGKRLLNLHCTASLLSYEDFLKKAGFAGGSIDVEHVGQLKPSFKSFPEFLWK